MLICAEYIFPVTSDPIANGAVLVRDGKIKDIGRAEILKLRYPEEELHDYGKAAIMPGLVDLFARLEKTVLRGVINDVPFSSWVLMSMEKASQLEASDWYDSAVVGVLDSLSSGITTVADLTSSGAVLRAMDKLGMRGVVYREVAAMDKQRVEYAMRAAHRDIEAWREDVDPERLEIGVAPAPAYAIHPSVYTRVAEYATEQNLPVALRIAGTREEFNFIMRGSSMFSVHTMDDSKRGYVEIPPWMPTGVTPVEYAANWGAFDAPRVLAVHAVHVNDDDIKTLLKYNTSICTCPRSNAQLGMGVAPVGAFLRAGLNVGLGTDSPAATEATDIISEMRVGMLLQRATDTRSFLDSATMLEMATIGGARALGLDHKIGSLEIGKQADIIAVNLSGSQQSAGANPVSAVVNTCSASDVLMTMVDGKVLYEEKQWNIDADVAKNIARVIEIRAKLKN